MEQELKKVFAGVELECTPECIKGKVTKEEAITALADAGAKAIIAGDFKGFKETTLWATAVNCNYQQITGEEFVETSETKVDVLEEVIKLLENNDTIEAKILKVIVKSLQQGRFSAVMGHAFQHNSPSWVKSLESAEEEILD